MFQNSELLEEMPKLQKFAYKLTKTEDEAHDLLQDTMLRAIEKRDMFADDTNLFSWTSKMMYNLFVSDYRRKVKYRTQYDPEPYINNCRNSASQEIKAEIHTIDTAMGQLSPEHQEILVMISIREMKYEEAADKLGIPVGTVRSRLYRARERLRELLNEEDVVMTITESQGPQLPFHLAA